MVDKNFSRLCAEVLYLVLLQLYGLAWAVSAHCDVVRRGSGTAGGAVGGQLTFKKTVDDRVKIDLRCSIRHVYVSSLGVVKGLGGLGWSCGSSKIIQTRDGLSVAETGWRGGAGREGERCERRGYDCTNTGSFAAATLKRNESGVGGQPAANAWMSRKSARLRKRVSGGLQ